ncbi:MAG: hypothetical protein M0Z41_04450 [Peptococcaceae bacterium]|jgi:hypothetical protein|nr:hypothetical protein [Peptococcaceae bacterium]
MPLLSIRVPKEHPLWNLPAGQRSTKVREALDLGLNLMLILEEIRDRLVMMDSRLQRLETGSGPAAGCSLASGPETGKDVIATTEATFDLAGFSDI